jgi:hypothetical protein
MASGWVGVDKLHKRSAQNHMNRNYTEICGLSFSLPCFQNFQNQEEEEEEEEEEADPVHDVG